MCMTNVVAALSLSLKTGDGTEGLHLVGCFQLLAEKQDALLLYRGSLLVAERGRAVKKNLVLCLKVRVNHLCTVKIVLEEPPAESFRAS